MFKKYDSFSEDELIDISLRRLKRIIKYAYEHVPFYRKIWSEAGFHPQKLKTLDDMNRIPIIDKSTCKSHLLEMISDEFKIAELTEHRTGGSTGIPGLFYYDKDMVRVAREGIDRWRYNAGVLSSFSKNVLLFRTPEYITNDIKRWGVGGEKYSGIYDMFANGLILSSMNLTESVKCKYVKKIKALKPDYIQGYASAISNLAKYIIKEKETLNCKAVLTSSDMLTEFMRQDIERAFQCRVFDRYGAGEGVATAIECEKHDGYHVDMDHCYIQILDDSGQEILEKSGSIVGTNLINYAMPLIRYNMRDKAKLTRVKCNCGRKSWRLYDIFGRMDDFICFKTGKIVESSALTQVIPNHLGNTTMEKITEYQFEQFSYEKLKINIVTKSGERLSKTEEKGFEFVFKEIFGENPQIEFGYYSSIDRGRSGKLRFIINHMNE